MRNSIQSKSFILFCSGQDWVCKVVISLQFYAKVSAINWMFVQGHYLNSKLTNIVLRKFHMRYYVFIGWGIPLGIVGLWSITTEIIYGTKCWKDFTKMRTIWILVVSLSVVLLVNLFLLLKILRFVISSTSYVNANETLTVRLGVRSKIKRGTKATAILFPLLGITNLVFFHNPGGTGQKYYMVAQASIHSLQGIITSILYCFICKDVREALRREYYKFQVKRGASVNGSQRFAVSVRSRDSRVSTPLHRREVVQIQRVAIDREHVSRASATLDTIQ
ncbi:unnamed protein product [Allacma fusca]|uniref:G-protein coupled receptors family 2 profile 2 domain-containing protein n=1 Tax=Allacma fusca TaxID=39272 RepID=A0A8J2JSS7_9HEXA|nr:unnamed protein product [Allacma fusca]